MSLSNMPLQGNSTQQLTYGFFDPQTNVFYAFDSLQDYSMFMSLMEQ